MVFDPATLSNKTLWVRAKDLGANGSSVTAWLDQSGCGNDLISAIGTAPTVNGTGSPKGGKSVAYSAGYFKFPTAQALIHADSSSVYINSRYAGVAFDGNAATPFTFANGTTTGWLRFRKTDGTTFVLTSYAITPPGGVQLSQSPRSWTFEGSADGSSWTTLDTRTGITFVSSTAQTFSFSNAVAYKFYRLNITANNGDATNTTLHELVPNAASTPMVGATPYEVWMVVKSAGTNNGSPWRIGSSLSDGYFPYTDGKVYDDLGGTARVDAIVTSPSAVGWHVVRIVQKNPGRELWIDGQRQYTDTGAYGSNDGILIGYSGIRQSTGEVAEVFVRQAISTATEQANLYSYFAAEQGTNSQGSPGSMAQTAMAQVYANVGASSVLASRAMAQIYADVLTPDNADEGIWDASALTPQADGSTLAAWPSTSGIPYLAPAVGSAALYKTNVVNGKSVIRFGGSSGFDTTMPVDTKSSFTFMGVIKPASTGLITAWCGKSSGTPQVLLNALRPVVNSSGNFAVMADATLPQLTSGVFYVVTVRYVNGGRYRTTVADRTNGSGTADKAVDGASGTYWEALSVSAGNPAWLQIEPPDGVVVAAKYTLTPLSGAPTSMPTTFKLQGSSSVNGPWTDVDSRSGITWVNNVAQTFTVTGSAAYRFYRLYVTATGSGTLDLLDFQLNDIPVRNPHTIVRVNGATYAQALRDHSSPLAFNTGNYSIGYRNGASESFNGDIAYLRWTNGEVDLGSIAARETALMTAYGLTPADTTNVTQPMKQVKATSNAGNGWQEALLTDHQGGANGNAWSANAAAPQTIVFDSVNKAAVKDYWMQARSDAPGSAPKDWLLQGSNDGSSWTTVDTRSGLGWAANEKKNFHITTPAEYAYYRIVISSTSDGVPTTLPSFAEMDLTGQTTIPPPILDGPVGGGGAVVVTEGFTLFGTRYAAGDPMPVGLSASIQRSLQRRGRLSSGGTETIRKAVNINGQAFAAGAAIPTVGLAPRQSRVLERGKIFIGNDD